MSWIPFDLMVPLLVAGLGALWSERAGILNIALEGQMLAGALAAVLFTKLTGDPLLALLGVVTLGALTGLILAWGTISLRADPFIAALGLNLLLPALAGWVSYLLFGNLGMIRLTGPAAVQIAGIPMAFVVAMVLAGISHVVLFKTPWGLRIRAAGTSPGLLESRGLRAARYQVQSLAVSGAMGALAGGFLSLQLGAFVPGISAGKGWIALVALYLGLRRPLPLIAACFALAWTDQLANALQGWRNLPAGVVLGLPSLLTVIVYVVTSAAQRKKHP